MAGKKKAAPAAPLTVDAVIAWVDGGDAAHRAKRRKFQGGGGEAVEKVALADRRFSDNDEIRYCLRSIRNYAPWIRKIWLITDRQQPRSIDMAAAADQGIEIVDHREIFRGFEALLPTFNSLSIETMMWRIPDLAEHFIYFNDDMLITRPVAVSDFFRDGKPLLRGKWQPWEPELPLSFHGHNRRNGAARAGFQDQPIFAATHVAHAMWRPVLEELWEEKLPEFAWNGAFRFRAREQFWPISMHDHRALATGRAVEFDGGRPDWQHFSVNFCKVAEEALLRERLDLIAGHKVKLTCLNYLEAVAEKVPEVMDFIDRATGMPQSFEGPAAA